MHLTPTRLGLALASASLLGLAACGGGSGGSTAVTTTFSGTAATGAALAGATVSISCASGTGSTTTASNGSYTKDLTGVTLPCVLRATSSDNLTTLYSVTTAASSGPQVANITPLTQLVVASLAGTDPATFFTNFATTASSVTPSNISAAQTAVLTTLSNAGVNVSSLPNLLTGSLTAGSGTGYDGVLDALATQLTTSGATLADLSTAVAAASPTTSTTTTSSVASLPASQLLKAADSNCTALRSSDYWVITPTMGGNIANQFHSSRYDAATKTVTNLADSSTSVFSDNGLCSYTSGGGNSNILVSQAGVLMARSFDSGNVARLVFGIPKQSIALSDLAGDWNALAFEMNNTNTGYEGKTWTATLNSTGGVSGVTECMDLSPSATCSQPTTNLPTFTSNSAGGFNVASATDTSASRAFAYRAGNGDLMLTMVDGDGSVSVWTKKRTLGLPTVGTIQNASWSIRTLDTLIASFFPAGDANTVTAVDTALHSYIRTTSALISSVKYAYSETILQNTPRDGYNFRAAGQTTATNGTTPITIRQRTSLNLRGMGVSVQSVPVQTGPTNNNITQAGFQMSVDLPPLP